MADEEIVALYRRVFATHDGRKVLLSILSDLGLFSSITGPEQQALHNYAVYLLRHRLGYQSAQGVMDLIRLITGAQ